MKFFYSPQYEIDLGGHVFPTIKYRFIRDRLLKEKLAKESDFVEPEPASEDDLLLVHTPEYVEKLKNGKFTINEIFRMEIPYRKEFFTPSLICAQGTILACKEALQNKVGIHIGGGFHHAYPDHGEGFCIINDIAIGIRRCLKDKDIQKAAIIDVDLHQGNGTAYIFRNDKNVFTFSIHQENNYPPKEKSDLDIGLEDGAVDEEYLSALEPAVSKIIYDFKPDLIVYVAGADPYKNDQLGGLNLTIEGLKKRDQLVFEYAKKEQIPLAITLGGGYAQDINDTVAIHVNTIKVARLFLTF